MIYVYASGFIAMFFYTYKRVEAEKHDTVMGKIDLFISKIVVSLIIAAIWPILFWYAIFEKMV